MNTRTRNKKIWNRLDQMNWHFGRGDVQGIRYVLPSTEYKHITCGFVARRLEYSADIRRFTLIGKTLYFLGHQSNIDRPMKI